MMNLISALQIENIWITKKGYEASMQLNTFHEQPFGFVNGGALLAFAEITAGQASNLIGEGKYHAVGQSINGSHLKSIKATGQLWARAELIHHGHRSHVWNIRMENMDGQPISLITVTNAIITGVKE